MTEEWRPVVGFEGLYEVSSRGRVRSLDRRVNTSSGTRLSRGQVLKGKRKNGYQEVSLGRNGSRNFRLVHRLVCEAFHGPAPEGKPWVLHRDGDKSNNTPGNLYWGDPKQNAQDMITHGNHRNSRKTHCDRGHAFSAENTISTPEGRRSCRTCHREFQGRNRLKYRLTKKEAGLPEGDSRHGSRYAYDSFGCRCGPCKGAKSRDDKDYHARRKQRESDTPADRRLRLDNEAQAA